MEKIILLTGLFLLLMIKMKRPQTIEEWGDEINYYISLVVYYHQQYFPDVSIALTLAIMENESSFNKDAYRYEAKINDASYGLMQILYQTAKWLGFEGKPEELFNPEINIFYGMKYLQWLISKGLPLDGVITAYNIGYRGYLSGRRNDVYLSRVLNAYEYWRGFYD